MTEALFSTSALFALLGLDKEAAFWIAVALAAVVVCSIITGMAFRDTGSPSDDE